MVENWAEQRVDQKESEWESKSVDWMVEQKDEYSAEQLGVRTVVEKVGCSVSQRAES
jgi:hypothetical protein